MQKDSNVQGAILLLLGQVQELPKTLYERIKAILYNTDSYETKEREKLKRLIPCAVEQIEATAETAHHRIQAVYDVVDDETGVLYPYSKLRPSCIAEIESIYSVSYLLFSAIPPDKLAQSISQLQLSNVPKSQSNDSDKAKN